MASHPVYQFYAVLDDYDSKIWRRFWVMDNITMARLGYIVMTLFEMQANHLFCLDLSLEENQKARLREMNRPEKDDILLQIYKEHPEEAKVRFELPDDEGYFGIDEFEGRVCDAAETKLKNYLREPGETIHFSYDFGDGWEVILTLEDIFESKAIPGKDLPKVLDGKGFGIIEDCGGPGGLDALAKAFKKKKGSRYQELRNWLGVDELDLDAFDIEDMNFRLKKLPRIFTDIYEYGLEPTKQSINLLMRKYKSNR